jgi:hypothetical protein
LPALWLLACLAISAALLPDVLGAQPIRVTGRVRAEGRQDGVSGAQVELLPAWEGYTEAVRRLRGEADPPLATARSDAGGFFEIAAPEAGAYRLRVRADGHLSQEYPLIPLIEDTDLEPAWLQSAEPFEVRVTGEDGRPLSGVRARTFQQWDSPAWQHLRGWLSVERGGVTGAAGRLALVRKPGETLKLVAVSPAFLGQSGRASPSGGSLLLVSRPALRLEVRSGDGRPVPGALVRWRSAPIALTGPDGRLDLAFPSGDEPLTVESRDGGCAQVAATPGAQGTVLAVRLEPPRTLTGQVLQKAAAPKPVPNALVWTGDRLLGPPAHAGKDGRFRFALSTPEEVSLQAAASGYLPGESRFVPKTSTQPTELRLEPAARIAGQVVDEAGRPVAGARLKTGSTMTSTMTSTIGPATTMSRGDGRFLFSGLRFQGTYEIRASHAGFTRASLTTRTPAPGQTAVPVRIVLESGWTAVGRVVDESGAAVAGAELRFFDGSEEVEGWRNAATDAEGRFELRALEPGRIALQVHAAGLSPVRRVVEVPAEPKGERLDLGTLQLPAGALIEGRVTDTRGLPIAAASVWFSEADSAEWLGDLAGRGEPAAKTDTGGRFRLAGLPAGEQVHLRIEHDGYVPLKVPGVGAPTREALQLEMKTARGLAGRVVGPDGEPVAEATLTQGGITLTDPSFSSSDRPVLASTDQQGVFRISGLEPGPADLRVTAQGYATRTVHGIPIPQDHDLDGFEIVLDRGTVLEVRVLSPEGAPVAGAGVMAQPKEPGTLTLADMDQVEGMNGSTDERGISRLAVARPGAWRVVASMAERSVSILVQAVKGTTPVELRFPTGVEFSGRVTDPQGLGIDGVGVTLTAERDHDPLRAVSREDGGFVLRQVPDGAFRLTARQQGFTQSGEPREVVVAGSDVRDLDVQLEPVAGATLTGHLLGLAPEEILQAHAWASGPGGFVAATVDPDGRYEIRNLQPGAWNVAVLTGSRRQMRQIAQIQAGDSNPVLDFDFGKGFTLTGRVLVDGAPLSGAMIQVGSQTAGRESAQTNFEGRFQVRNLAPGQHVVLVFATRGITGYGQPVDVESDTDVTIEIPTGVLHGRVVSAGTGEPISGVTVTISPQGLAGQIPSLFSIAAISSGDDGFFESRLAPGTYQVTVQKEGYATAQAMAEVRPGGAGAPVEIRLKPVGAP